MQTPRKSDRVLTGFAMGVVLTLLVFSVAFALGRLRSGGEAPPPITPNLFPTLANEPSTTPTPAMTSTPIAASNQTPSPAALALTPTIVPATPSAASTPVATLSTPAAAPPTLAPPSPTAVPTAPPTIPPTVTTLPPTLAPTAPAPAPTLAPTIQPSPPAIAPTIQPSTPTPAVPTTPTVTQPAQTPSPSLQNAIALVEAKGYQVIDAAHYDSAGPLGVLIGWRLIQGESAEYAYFFVDGQYIGTDLPESSASLSVAAQTGDTVVLRYALYRTADPECCPTGGYADVPYHWDGARLTPLAPYPPYQADAELSRR